ncbi:hypothetical protein TNCT_329531 [Trichonephila clavata]|uniref:Uncharacterized protein n=1 Tax=Trichonephila clavata TaxID=2740835 RepID=A0A8X6FIP1_TRICU|nr:hypothetical protein TNCT_329531 [Trichonephila clavata]
MSFTRFFVQFFSEIRVSYPAKVREFQCFVNFSKIRDSNPAVVSMFFIPAKFVLAILAKVREFQCFSEVLQNTRQQSCKCVRVSVLHSFEIRVSNSAKVREFQCFVNFFKIRDSNPDAMCSSFLQNSQ